MSNTFYAILGVLLPFACSVAGSLGVYFIRAGINKKLNSIIMGFSGGIMLAASVWSMIIPSFAYTQSYGSLSFLPAAIGTLLGCGFVLLTDVLLNKTKLEPSKTSVFANKKLGRFLIAFTVHNIPEGLAVGFAIGGALSVGTSAAMLTALTLAIGIAVQNTPEGLAVALPVYKATGNKNKSFLTSVLSSAIEPVFAVLGLLIATHIKFLMPWLLCFAAGCMIFVTIEDLVPESKLENSHIGTWAFFAGFLIMMLLDVMLS